MMHEQSEQIVKLKILVTGTAGFIGYHLAKKLFDLINDFGYKPDTSLEVGIERFLKWYREFYKIRRNN